MAPEEDFVAVPMEFRILGVLQECLEELEDNVSSAEPRSQRGLGSESPSRQLRESFWDGRHGKAVGIVLPAAFPGSQHSRRFGVCSWKGFRIWCRMEDGAAASFSLGIPGLLAWKGHPCIPTGSRGGFSLPSKPQTEFLIPLGSWD